MRKGNRICGTCVYFVADREETKHLTSWLGRCYANPPVVNPIVLASEEDEHYIWERPQVGADEFCSLYKEDKEKQKGEWGTGEAFRRDKG